MQEKKMIGFFGDNQGDLCIYAATVLAQLKFRVLVADCSGEQELFSCIPRPQQSLEVCFYKGVDYTTGVSLRTLATEEYDYVFLYMDSYPDKAALTMCEEVFAVITCERKQLEGLRHYMKQMHIPMNVILRNVCGHILSGKHYFFMLEQENVFVMERFCIPLDEVDEEYRITMQYESYKNFEKLSGGYMKVLIRLIRMISGKDRTVVARAAARAKKGAWI